MKQKRIARPKMHRREEPGWAPEAEPARPNAERARNRVRDAEDCLRRIDRELARAVR